MAPEKEGGLVEHEEKQLIRKVIDGFTYHEKYRLYKALAEDLKEPDTVKAVEPETKKRMRTPQRAVVEDTEAGGNGSG